MVSNDFGAVINMLHIRKERRINLHTLAYIEHKKRKYQGKISDVSPNGAFFKVDGNFKVNDKVKISICFVSDSATLSLTASSKVAHTNSDGIGLKLPKLNVFKLMYLDYLTTTYKDDPARMADEFNEYFTDSDDKWTMSCMKDNPHTEVYDSKKDCREK